MSFKKIKFFNYSVESPYWLSSRGVIINDPLTQFTASKTVFAMLASA